MNEKMDIGSLSVEELRDFVINELNDKKFRADQIYSWLHEKNVTDFDEMTNLSKELREKLKEKAAINKMEKLECQVSKLDETRKMLYRTYDNRLVESVIMKYSHGYSICISSQIGCNMGCKFCASTIGGKERNLSPYEMLSQIYEAQKEIGNRISNVVVMGMGEPLENFDNLIKFVIMITDKKGLNISQRNITISTCGLVDRIYELADLKPSITLAISLHASNDEKRREIMPIAKRYSIEELTEACNYYFKQTGRRITLEYCMIKDFNVSLEDARDLAEIAGKIKAHVNLIPVNPVNETGFKSPDKSLVNRFRTYLEKNRVNVTVRREMGRDIDGACGQLRHRSKLKYKE